MLNAVPQRGLPTEARLMIYLAGYSLVLAELSCQEGKSELLV